MTKIAIKTDKITPFCVFLIINTAFISALVCTEFPFKNRRIFLIHTNATSISIVETANNSNARCIFTLFQTFIAICKSSCKSNVLP